MSAYVARRGYSSNHRVRAFSARGHCRKPAPRAQAAFAGVGYNTPHEPTGAQVTEPAASAAIAPGPAEGVDLGGTDESLARMQGDFEEVGETNRVVSPARGIQ